MSVQLLGMLTPVKFQQSVKVAVSFLTRDEAGFIAAIPTLENYQRLLDPLYLKVFLKSAMTAGLSKYERAGSLSSQGSSQSLVVQ